MPSSPPRATPWTAAALCRVSWTLVSAFVVESLVFGLAVLPAALFWEWHFGWNLPSTWVRTLVLSMSFIPAYFIFALTLVILSAWSTRITGWRTPGPAEMAIEDLGWPLLDWVRYAISIHLVRVFAGPLFRSTPLWTFYMRLNGARLGRRVYVNSLAVTDHNLLEFGDDVVIGGGVHLSGHTVEKGILKTAPVKLGKNVTIGVGSVIDIGVEAGADCQVGALALVPKFSKLEAGSVYVGIPVRKLEKSKESNVL
ncbi:MAG TPA: hypothetical protein VJB88_00835 [Vicinamibacteria bacterium]|nr:hypothetical protein [Vicinamibacteria bacterium]